MQAVVPARASISSRTLCAKADALSNMPYLPSSRHSLSCGNRSILSPFIEFLWFYFMHVLRMADIHNSDDVPLNFVGVIPLVGVGHIIFSPTGNGGFSSRQRAFYLEDGVVGIIGILMHQLLGICMLILLGDIAVERDYLLGTTLPDNILKFRVSSFSLGITQAGLGPIFTRSSVHTFAYSSRIAA